MQKSELEDKEQESWQDAPHKRQQFIFLGRVDFSGGSPGFYDFMNTSPDPRR
jgi:hypothetical protein